MGLNAKGCRYCPGKCFLFEMHKLLASIKKSFSTRDTPDIPESRDWWYRISRRIQHCNQIYLFVCKQPASGHRSSEKFGMRMEKISTHRYTRIYQRCRLKSSSVCVVCISCCMVHWIPTSWLFMVHTYIPILLFELVWYKQSLFLRRSSFKHDRFCSRGFDILHCYPNLVTFFTP